jgi:hypothetical protein
VINVVADGAFGVADAVRVAERNGHGRSVRARAESSTPKSVARTDFAVMLPA